MRPPRPDSAKQIARWEVSDLVEALLVDVATDRNCRVSELDPALCMALEATAITWWLRKKGDYWEPEMKTPVMSDPERDSAKPTVPAPAPKGIWKKR